MEKILATKIPGLPIRWWRVVHISQRILGGSPVSNQGKCWDVNKWNYHNCGRLYLVCVMTPLGHLEPSERLCDLVIGRKWKVSSNISLMSGPQCLTSEPKGKTGELGHREHRRPWSCLGLRGWRSGPHTWVTRSRGFPIGDTGWLPHSTKLRWVR